MKNLLLMTCLAICFNLTAETQWVNAIQPNPLTYTGFGDSIAIMDEWLVVGDPLNSDQVVNGGAIHVYKDDGGQWILHQTLYPESADANDRLGTAVDIERNHQTGELWIVGSAPMDDDVSLDLGAVYAYALVNPSDPMSQFEFARKFLAEANRSQNFGTSVAINYDYIEEIDAHLWVLVVGDNYYRYPIDSNFPNGSLHATGGVKVYKKLDGIGNYFWEEEPVQVGAAYIDDFIDSIDLIGTSVAVDGKFIAVGAPGDDDHNLPNNDGVDMGAVHVLYRDGLTQTWQCCSIYLPDTRVRTAKLGTDVEIIKQPGSNIMLMAGAPFETDGSSRQVGAVHVWYNNGYVQKILPTVILGGQGEHFGASIAANGDEFFGSKKLIVGAPFSEDKKGRIYTYILNPNFQDMNDMYLESDQIVAFNRNIYPWDNGQFGSQVSSDGRNHASSSVANYVGNHKSVYTQEQPIFVNGFESNIQQ
jgi:hypothetical protein